MAELKAQTGKPVSGLGVKIVKTQMVDINARSMLVAAANVRQKASCLDASNLVFSS